MSINVVMPPMGESIFEGTVTKWLKKTGDKVARDEPLFEISTDKVDSEIPSPASGLLGEIVVPEGQTVKIGTVVAILEEAPAVPVEAPAVIPREAEETAPAVETVAEEAQAAAAMPEPVEAATVDEPAALPVTGKEGGEEAPQAAPLIEAAAPEVEPQTPPVEAAPQPVPAAEAAPVVETKTEEAPEIEPRRARGAVQPADDVRTSPLVRRIARDYGVDLSQIQGTGLSGRITKEDIFIYLERHGKKEVRPTPAPATAPPPATVHLEEPGPASPPPHAAPAATTGEPAPVIPPPKAAPAAAPAAPAVPEEPVPVLPIEVPKFHGETETVTMSPMRKAIAERMIVSKRTSAHVHTVFEVDVTSIVQLREKHKDEFEAREGFKLTYTPFFVKALVDTVRDFPIFNSSLAGDKIIFKKPINVGIAVALDTGLIVPVIRDAQLKSFTGLALAIREVAERARTKRLKPEEVQHGTITITNPGAFGSLFGTPIINQPQVAILGVGSLEKRPVIINDAIAIRTMVYLALSFDHRVIDGAVADQFMASLKSRLQSWSQWAE